MTTDPVNDDNLVTDGTDGDQASGGSWTRRGLIAGVAAAGAGAAAGLLGAATPAGAANGDTITVGGSFTGSATTTVTTTAESALAGVTSADTWSGIAGSDNSSGGGQGVFGVSQHGIGVWGVNPDPSGLLGTDVAGVVGDSNSSSGVLGLSSSSAGVLGKSSGAHQSGVGGYDTSTGGGWGVYASSEHGTGLGAVSTSGLDIEAAGTGRFRQEAQATAGAPPQSDVAYFAGEQVRDALGAMYLCVESGSPGTWVRVATGPSAYASGASCLLPTPIRLLDTRPNATAPDHPGTPVTGDGKITVPITGQSVGGVSIPAGAVAVIGNVTAVNAVAHGYLTLWPDGVTQPETSSINFPATTSVANGVTVALSTEGKMEIYASQTTDVVFDATGFIA